jgi:hypothetical protein
MNQDVPASAQVYLTCHICKFYDCHPTEVNKMIGEGVIPAPIPTHKPKAKKRWLRSVVNKHLGLQGSTENSNDYIAQIAERISKRVIAEALNGLTGKESQQ